MKQIISCFLSKEFVFLPLDWRIIKEHIAEKINILDV